MSPDFENVIRTTELLLLELYRIDHHGPEFTIIHSYRIGVYGAECQAGEEVSRVVLVHRGKQVIVPLALATRLVFDYLARTRHIPQTAAQIAAGIRFEPFYRQHGINTGEPTVRKICRTAIKEYVKRIRQAMAVSFKLATLLFDPLLVLTAEQTDGKEVLYQLRASVEWLHIDDIVELHPRIQRGK